MTPEALSRTVQFLSEASGAVVLEDGAMAFDLERAKYSISGEHNKCLLHLWSAERNTVRRVLDAEVKNGTLRLAVQRLGQTRPTKLEICRERDRRSPSAKKAARASYDQKLRHALERHFPRFAITRLTTGVDLEKSFGPIYARGLLRRGQSACAVLGVNEKETQASIDVPGSQ
jgi:predicted RNA-binding protein